MFDALDRLGDRHDVVAEAQRLSALGGVGERFVRGEAVGQHHRMHARSAKASTAIAAQSAESTPPDKPRTTPGKRFFST